jgi:hypothetical protein
MVPSLAMLPIPRQSASPHQLVITSDVPAATPAKGHSVALPRAICSTAILEYAVTLLRQRHAVKV